MIYVEDFLEYLADIFANNDKLRVSDWDRNFITDVANHTKDPDPNQLVFQIRRQRSPGLTSSQASVVLKLLQRHKGLIDKSYHETLNKLISAPAYRIPVTETAEIKREVRWIGGSKLLFRFKYNAGIAEDFKNGPIKFELKIFSGVNYNQDFKVWGLCVDNLNYDIIMKLIQKHAFEFDDDVLEFFMNINNNVGKQSQVSLTPDHIAVEINNDILASNWLQEMEWLYDV